jgi:uncharacterized protein with PIN domain
MGSGMSEGYRQRLARLLAGEARGAALARRLVSRAGCRGLDLWTLHRQVRERVERRGEGPHPPFAIDAAALELVCDGSLGGLARWLRGAGYPARFARGRSGRSLAAEPAGSEVLLTSDSRVTARSAVRRGELRALWIPVDLHPADQLGLVLEDLRLPLREPRCMRCGGEQRAVAKAEVAHRIPPRTARWLDDYFVCRGCDWLYWRGTHWRRIEARLAGRVVP